MGNTAIYQLGWIMALVFGLSSIILIMLWVRALNTIRRLRDENRNPAPSGSSQRPQADVGPQPPQKNFPGPHPAVSERSGEGRRQFGDIPPPSDQTHIFKAPKDHDPPHLGPQWSLPFLKVLTGSNPDTIHHLPYGETTIGRDATNLIVLNDSHTSSVNTKIIYHGHAFVVQDNQSTNGTFHQGKPVSQAMLTFGDRIGIGNSELVFSCKGFELKETAPAEAISAFEAMLAQAPNWIAVLKNLAYLLERDAARRKQAQPIWDRVLKLEKSASKTHDP